MLIPLANSDGVYERVEAFGHDSCEGAPPLALHFFVRGGRPCLFAPRRSVLCLR
jgi:hypothetical protein